jgi:hypothetical protein
MRPESKQVSQVPRAPGNDGVEPIGELSHDGLEPFTNNRCLSERQLADSRRKKRNPTLPRLDHRQPKFRINQLEGNSGNSRSRPRVENIAS